MEMKVELMKLGKKQIDVIKILNEKGLHVSACDMSSALAGFNTPKMQKIREETEKLINIWKGEAESK